MGELAEYLAQNDADFRKARLPALYADFRPQRTLNPDGYRANIAAWRHGLSLLASRGLLSKRGASPNALVFNVDDSLLRDLESRQYGQPLALGTAIRESVSDHTMFPLQTFLQSPHNVFQKSWSGIPWAVMGWTLRQIGIVDPARGEDKLPKGQYVITENLHSATKQFGSIMEEHQSRFDRIFTKAQFHNTFASDLIEGQRLSETDTDVLLRHLSRDKDMIEFNGKIIRVKATAGSEPPGISEDDVAIASVKELTTRTKHQADLLDARVEELEQEAKKALARKNKVSAMAALRSKKAAETTLAARYATLNQLEEVVTKIEQASDNIQLVKVMEASSGVLKSLNAQVGSAEKVDDVMFDLREQMTDTEELSNMLADSSIAPVDEGEVDEELELMEKEIKEREDREKAAAGDKEAQAALERLGEVPAGTPQGEKVPDREAQKVTM
ncbi:hypothetical protein K4F52_006653 [Lecanicillium sp. MT-2017a]|nr:hypothetical protein K4F52_006653 [Lecanicillium sp. MT-2017a]